MTGEEQQSAVEYLRNATDYKWQYDDCTSPAVHILIASCRICNKLYYDAILIICVPSSALLYLQHHNGQRSCQSQSFSPLCCRPLKKKKERKWEERSK